MSLRVAALEHEPETGLGAFAARSRRLASTTSSSRHFAARCLMGHRLVGTARYPVLIVPPGASQEQ
jgi:hypothetical protein